MDGGRRLLAALALYLPAEALAEGPVLSVVDGHAGHVLALDWSADGRFLLSGGSDETARLWHVEEGALVRRFSRSGCALRSTACRCSTPGCSLAKPRKDAVVNEALLADPVRHAQTPQLFDFDRRSAEVIISF